jgi:hypothetical protein
VVRYRLLMLLGWLALAGGPLLGWLAGRPDQGPAVAYGGGGARWAAALGAAVPAVFAAALLLLNGALRARARHRRGELALGVADRALVAGEPRGGVGVRRGERARAAARHGVRRAARHHRRLRPAARAVRLRRARARRRAGLPPQGGRRRPRADEV